MYNDVSGFISFGDYIDDLIDEWHLDYDGIDDLLPFLMQRTGLKASVIKYWLEMAELPREN